jgi:hypothetical protein
MPDPTHAVWRTSTHSGNRNECVEIADNLAPGHGTILIRDSKNRTGPTLTFTPHEWTTFTNTLRHHTPNP